mgnify:CR=1 FL=1
MGDRQAAAASDLRRPSSVRLAHRVDRAGKRGQREAVCPSPSLRPAPPPSHSYRKTWNRL